jgi:hypothetical protein
MGGQIGEYGPVGRDGRIREYIFGCLGMWIVECGRNACEVSFGDSIPRRVGGGIAENGTFVWEDKTRE